MTRIFFISRISLLSGRTNVYNFVKTAEALNGQDGFKVKLITTDSKRDTESFFEKMSVKNPFEITFLGTETGIEILTLAWSNICMSAYLLLNINKFDAIYFRDESLAPAAWWTRNILGKFVFFEIHSVLQSKRRQKLNEIGAKVSNGMIAISGGLKRFYNWLNTNIIVSLCSASEESWFDYSHGKEYFREELGLPRDKFVVSYTGVVGANPNNDYYEVDDIVKSLSTLPKEIIFVIVGEIGNNANWLREIANKHDIEERVIILPWQDRNKIPKFLLASDIILIPKRKKDLIGDSPAKMFPALAAKRPIIGGKTECIEEVLTDKLDSIIVKSNTPEGWKDAILEIYNNPDLAQKLSDAAWITKNKYTWPTRGKVIGKFIKDTIIGQ